MPLTIIRQDITKMQVDAIVNPSNSALIPGGGTDKAIHKAAGVRLAEECAKLGGCKTGEAKVTKGFLLPCRYVIHTAGPKWNGGSENEEELLKKCYENCLKKAEEYDCASVAFPLISSGSHGFPKEKVLHVAADTIKNHLYNTENDLDVYLAVYDNDSFTISEKLFSNVESYIDSHYVEERAYGFSRPSAALFDALPSTCGSAVEHRKNAAQPKPESSILYESVASSEPDIDELIKMTDESFSQMLLRKIDEKGIKDSECYKKANIDRKLFSKIRSNIHYKPRKTTALAFAVALELTLEETKEMLMKAGFALTHADKGDIIVEYFIIHGKYDIFEINEVLFKYDQALLGS